MVRSVERKPWAFLAERQRVQAQRGRGFTVRAKIGGDSLDAAEDAIQFTCRVTTTRGAGRSLSDHWQKKHAVRAALHAQPGGRPVPNGTGTDRQATAEAAGLLHRAAAVQRRGFSRRRPARDFTWPEHTTAPRPCAPSGVGRRVGASPVGPSLTRGTGGAPGRRGESARRAGRGPSSDRIFHASTVRRLGQCVRR